MGSTIRDYGETSRFFPLRDVGGVRDLFEAELAREEPDLALLSAVVGYLENQWTQARAVPDTPVAGSAEDRPDGESLADGTNNPCLCKISPPLEWHTMEALLAKFEGIVRGYCEVALLEAAQKSQEAGEEGDGSDCRRIIKHVADIVWNTLSKSHYKDRPHLQSLYSYLTGNKLDCFGVAFAVVAACQLLNVKKVHLALSEDHAWVVFGEEGTFTAEVTWHGKGNEDKRGQPVDIEKAKTSWLYLAGQPVVCDRHMEVAALVSSINPAMTASVDSIECGTLQQELLWLLYDKGHLKHYPMALGNLGDLEEISASLGRPPCDRLFEEAVAVDRSLYANHHVYPYTYQAGYFYRTRKLKKALESWAEAADVIKVYRYSKDDEEIYKEFMEIANELIPHLVKSASHKPEEHREVLRDPECFAFILRFYDGICCWEEDSATPVLHIGWAKPMVSTCSKFEADIRSKVVIPKDSGESLSSSDEGKLSKSQRVPEKTGLEEDVVIINNNYCKMYDRSPCERRNKQQESKCDKARESSEEEESRSSSSSNITKNGSLSSSSRQREVMNMCDRNDVSKEIERLSEGCSERLLNADYLLGRQSSEPFLQRDSPLTRHILRGGSRVPGKKKKLNYDRKNHILSDDFNKEGPAATKVFLRLFSAKMRGLRDLLCNAEKLNASAIQLQLTAQSQTVSAGETSAAGAGEEHHGRPKRARRE